MVSTRQAQALRLQCTKTLGMSETEYKALIGRYGVKSSKQLSLQNYNQLMGQLKGQPPKTSWMPKADKQMGLIFHLWGVLHQDGKVRDKSHTATLHWMAKYLRQPNGVIQFTPYQKSRCIEQLKKWIERD